MLGTIAGGGKGRRTRKKSQRFTGEPASVRQIQEKRDWKK